MDESDLEALANVDVDELQRFADFVAPATQYSTSEATSCAQLDGSGSSHSGSPEQEACWAMLLGWECLGHTHGQGKLLAEKFCSKCRINGILVELSRVRALTPAHHSLFRNSTKAGFWTVAADTNYPPYRVINHTSECSGPWLVVFKSGPSSADCNWAEVPPEWVENGNHVRLWLAKGTMTPLPSRKKHNPQKRSRAVSTQPGAASVVMRPQLPLSVDTIDFQCRGGQEEEVDRYIGQQKQLRALIEGWLAGGASPSPRVQQQLLLREQLKLSTSVLLGQCGLEATWRQLATAPSKAELKLRTSSMTNPTRCVADVIEINGSQLAGPSTPSGLRRDEAYARQPLSLGSVLRAIGAGQLWGGRQPDSALDAGLSRQVNHQLRHTVLRQQPFTNRFVGWPLAERAELAFSEFITHYQLHKVQWRLLKATFVLPAIVYGQGIPALHAPDGVAAFVNRAILPPLCLLLGVLLCSLPRTRQWWRMHASVSLVLCFLFLMLSDFWIECSKWSTRDKDFQTMWQLIWLLVAMVSGSLLFALDLGHVACVLSLQWVAYVVCTLGVYRQWWVMSGQGPWVFSFQPSAVVDPQMALAEMERECTLRMGYTNHAPSHPPPPGGYTINMAGNLSLGASNRSDWNYTQVSYSTMVNPGHSRTLLDCLIFSLCSLVMLILAARRLNRFEREAFVNSWAMLKVVQEQKASIVRGRVELLAVFSNPRVERHIAGELALRPLQVGQELKALLHSIPSIYLAIEPAAQLADVKQALHSLRPSCVHFSGHTVMGSLVFELPSGAVEIPDAEHFIEILRDEVKTPGRLQCVILNACETSTLGNQIVQALPMLTVVCWSTLTEDGAARAFASGFYDAIGMCVTSHGPIGPDVIEIAFKAGVEHFLERGYAFGDPRQFAHPPDHPHTIRPQFSHCMGCCPPVHGEIVLMRGADVEAKNKVSSASEIRSEQISVV